MIEVSKIQTISIDFWNTLVDGTNTNERKKQRIDSVYNILKSYKTNLIHSQIEDSIKFGIQYFNLIWENEHRTLGSKEIISHLLEHLKISVLEDDFEKITNVFENGILVSPPGLAPEVLTVIPKLSRRYKLGIISDTHFSPGRVIKKLLEQYGLLSYFSAFAFSDEMGVSKPDAKMYERIMSETGSINFTTCHIGDMVRTDMLGAKKLGIKSILYTGINSQDETSDIPDIKLKSWTEIGHIFLK